MTASTDNPGKVVVHVVVQVQAVVVMVVVQVVVQVQAVVVIVVVLQDRAGGSAGGLDREAGRWSVAVQALC